MCIIVSDDDDDQATSIVNNSLTDQHESSNEADIIVYPEQEKRCLIDLTKHEPSEADKKSPYYLLNQNGSYSRHSDSSLGDEILLLKTGGTQSPHLSSSRAPTPLSENQSANMPQMGFSGFFDRGQAKNTDLNQNENSRQPHPMARSEVTTPMENSSSDKPLNQCDENVDSTGFPKRNDRLAGYSSGDNLDDASTQSADIPSAAYTNRIRSNNSYSHRNENFARMTDPSTRVDMEVSSAGTEQMPSNQTGFNFNQSVTNTADTNIDERGVLTSLRYIEDPEAEYRSRDEPLNLRVPYVDGGQANDYDTDKNESYRAISNSRFDEQTSGKSYRTQSPEFFKHDVNHTNISEGIYGSSSKSIQTTFAANATLSRHDLNGGVRDDGQYRGMSSLGQLASTSEPCNISVSHRLHPIVPISETRDGNRMHDKSNRQPVIDNNYITLRNIVHNGELSRDLPLIPGTSMSHCSELDLELPNTLDRPQISPTTSLVFNMEGSPYVYTNKGAHKTKSHEENPRNLHEFSEASTSRGFSDSCRKDNLIIGKPTYSLTENLEKDTYQLPDAASADDHLIDTSLLPIPDFLGDMSIEVNDASSWIMDMPEATTPTVSSPSSPTISFVLNAEEKPIVYTNKHLKAKADDQTQLDHCYTQPPNTDPTTSDIDIVPDEALIASSVADIITDEYQLSADKGDVADTTLLPPPDFDADMILEDRDASSLLLDLFTFSNDTCQLAEESHTNSKPSPTQKSNCDHETQKEPVPTTSNSELKDVFPETPQPSPLLHTPKVESSAASIGGSVNKDEQDSFLDDIFGTQEVRPIRQEGYTAKYLSPLASTSSSSTTPSLPKFNINSRYDFKSVSKTAYTPSQNFQSTMRLTPNVNGKRIRRNDIYSSSPTVPIKITYTTKTGGRLNGSMKLVSSPIQSTIVKRQNYIKTSPIASESENVVKTYERKRNDKNSSIISSFSYKCSSNVGKAGQNGTKVLYKATDMSPATILERKTYVKTSTPTSTMVKSSLSATMRNSPPSCSFHIPHTQTSNMSMPVNGPDARLWNSQLTQRPYAYVSNNNNRDISNSLSSRMKLLTKKCVVACDPKTIVDYCQKKNMSLSSLTVAENENVVHADANRVNLHDGGVAVDNVTEPGQMSVQMPGQMLGQMPVQMPGQMPGQMPVQTSSRVSAPTEEGVKEQMAETSRRLSNVSIPELDDTDDLLFTPFKKRMKYTKDHNCETIFEFSDIFNNFDGIHSETPNAISSSRILSALGETLETSDMYDAGENSDNADHSLTRKSRRSRKRPAKLDL